MRFRLGGKSLTVIFEEEEQASAIVFLKSLDCTNEQSQKNVDQLIEVMEGRDDYPPYHLLVQ